MGREQAAIAKRADQQHRWVMAGDPRGTYGDQYAEGTDEGITLCG